MTQEGGRNDGNVSDHLVSGASAFALKKIYPMLTGFSRLDLFNSSSSLLQPPLSQKARVGPSSLTTHQSFNTLVKHLHVVAIVNIR